MASKNGRQPSTPDLGSIRTPLQTPEPCGEISIGEAAEIKARNDLTTKLNEQLVDLQSQVTHLALIRKIAENEGAHFWRALLKSHGLDERDEYSVNPDTGTIVRVAEMKPVVSTVEQETPAVEDVPAGV